MNNDKYESLRTEREHIKKLLKGSVPVEYKKILENRLTVIRTKISNAHRGQNK